MPNKVARFLGAAVIPMPCLIDCGADLTDYFKQRSKRFSATKVMVATLTLTKFTARRFPFNKVILLILRERPQLLRYKASH